MRREVFVKTFIDFRQGFEELKRLCPPARDTVVSASAVWAPLGVALNGSYREIVEHALMCRANSPGSIRERAIATGYGFGYKTTSNCVFGWQVCSSNRYNMFVRTDRFWLQFYRERLMADLTRAGFAAFDKRFAISYVGHAHFV